MKRILFVFCLTCILTGCVSVEGTYITNYYTGEQGKLYINKDHSFIFFPPLLWLSSGSIYEETVGTWEKKKNYIVLNSNFRDTISEIHIEEIFCPDVSTDSILFKVYDMVTGKPIRDFMINTIYDTNEKGELMLPKMKDWDEVSLQIFNRYNFTNENTNVLNVYYLQYAYWYFIDEPYKIEKDRLIEYDGAEFIKIKQK